MNITLLELLSEGRVAESELDQETLNAMLDLRDAGQVKEAQFYKDRVGTWRPLETYYFLPGDQRYMDGKASTGRSRR